MPTPLALISALAIASASVFAFADTTTVPSAPLPLLPAGQLQIGGTYETNDALKVTPVAFVDEEGAHPNTDNEAFEFDPNDAFIIGDRSVDASGREIVRVQTDFEDQSDFWILARELPTSALRYAWVDNTTVDLDPAMNFTPQDGVKDLPEDVLVEARWGRWGRYSRYGRGRRGGSYCTTHPRSRHCCFSAVKGLLLSMGLVNHRLKGVSASAAASQLRSGWKEVGCGIRHGGNIPRGTTCTQRGRRHGHVETWNGRCWYYGARCAGPTPDSRGLRCFSCKVPRR